MPWSGFCRRIFSVGRKRITFWARFIHHQSGLEILFHERCSVYAPEKGKNYSAVENSVIPIQANCIMLILIRFLVLLVAFCRYSATSFASRSKKMSTKYFLHSRLTSPLKSSSSQTLAMQLPGIQKRRRSGAKKSCIYQNRSSYWVNEGGDGSYTNICFPSIYTCILVVLFSYFILYNKTASLQIKGVFGTNY